MCNLILLRHGQSQWNLENRFTGWKDVSLTNEGIVEAEYAGKILLKKDLKISSIHTSILKRALETTKIVSNILEFPKNKIQYNWRLNERHYGALEGLNKSETAKKYGEEQVKIWRRSFDIPPPYLNEDDDRHPKNNTKFNEIKCKLPVGESLKDVIFRLEPFLKDYFNFLKENPGNHLIIAHSNSLRAIVKIIENFSSKSIMNVNIPTGIPLVYNIDRKINVINKYYLIDDKTLQEKQELVKNQGKV